MDITTSSPTANAPIQTVDGWSIKIDRYLVHVAAVNVVGLEGTLAASSGPQIIDQIAPGPKPLLSATVRTARRWEDVNFQISPADATAPATPLEPVTDEDRIKMELDGYAIYIEATATKVDVTKTLKLGLHASTTFKNCSGDLPDGTRVLGLNVPPDGNDTADVIMSAEVLFSDDLGAPGAVLRANAIAAADTDNDGVVTMNDLRGIPLQVVQQTTGAPYLVATNPEVSDLGAFLDELSRKTVKAFRSSSGTCVVQPTPPPE